MDEEIKTLRDNHTWILVSSEAHMNIVGSKWVFKTKLNSNGTLNKLKAPLVATGFS